MFHNRRWSSESDGLKTQITQNDSGDITVHPECVRRAQLQGSTWSENSHMIFLNTVFNPLRQHSLSSVVLKFFFKLVN